LDYTGAQKVAWETDMRATLASTVLSALALTGAMAAMAAEPSGLPPPIGSETPRVEPLRDDGGLYHQSWFNFSFLDLKEDFAEAKNEGKRFAIIFEQRGCPYCVKLHNEILSQRYINDYLRQNFRILQLDLWGSREVTDFDGTKLREKLLAERWGVIFTPTIVFFKDDLTRLDGKWGRELEAVERMPLSFGRDTFYDLFVWVRHKIYERDKNFQRFHISRIGERDAIKNKQGSVGRTN
jgi:thioredoxin-related protein